jgi:hypothetical protein
MKMLRNFGHLYGEDKILVAISSMIAAFHQDNRVGHGYVDTQVIMQDLQYSLTGVIANLLISLPYHVIGISEVEGIIDTHNKNNKTAFSFEYFRKRGWLRVINAEVKLPHLIASHIRQILNPENKNRPSTPEHLTAEVDCMVALWQHIKAVENVFINEEDVKKAIFDAHSAVDIEFLVSNKILERKQDHHYEFSAESYTGQLRNQITALLWLNLVESNETIDDFRKFIRLIQSLARWPDKLEEYMPRKSLLKLHELSIRLINEEADLMDNAMELTNYILDGPSYHSWDLNTPIPIFPLDVGMPFDTIREIINYEKWYSDLFEHEECRYEYVLLIKFIIEYDFSNSPYVAVKDLLINHNSLFVKWKIFEEIGRVYPEVMPFFLKDKELISTAFLCIQQFEVNSDLIKTEQKEEANEQILVIKDEIWMGMFDYVIKQAAMSYSPDEY